MPPAPACLAPPPCYIQPCAGLICHVPPSVYDGGACGQENGGSAQGGSGAWAQGGVSVQKESAAAHASIHDINCSADIALEGKTSGPQYYPTPGHTKQASRACMLPMVIAPCRLQETCCSATPYVKARNRPLLQALPGDS